jgi:hypothetical protein
MAFRGCPHFVGRVAPGQRSQFVNHGVGPDPCDGSLHRSGVQRAGDDGFRANIHRWRRTGRSRKREDLMLVRSQAVNQRPPDGAARAGNQNFRRVSS